MNIYPSQQSIVAKLQADFVTAEINVDAKDLPETESGYDAGLKKAIAYVVFTGSTASPSIAVNVVAQPRKLRFSVEIHSKKLYGETGLFLVRDIVEQSIIGFEPTNCKTLTLVKDDITKTDEGIWVHVYQLECETMLVQKESNEPIIVPAFEEIVKND